MKSIKAKFIFLLTDLGVIFDVRNMLLNGIEPIVSETHGCGIVLIVNVSTSDSF